MKTSARRRMALGSALTAGTLVAVTLVTMAPASAAVVSVTPSSTGNTETKPITVTTNDIASGNRIVFTGPSVSAVPNEGTSFSVAAAQDPAATAANQGRGVYDSTNPVNFATVEGGEPADPGAYRVRIDATATGPATMTTSADCPGTCFTVTSAAPTPVSVEPETGPQSETPTVVITGSGFAISTRVEFLLPGTDTVDTGLVVSNAFSSGTTKIGATPTRLTKRVAIAPSAATGPRDVRLTNTDGEARVLPGGFTVVGASLDSVTPQAQANDRQQQIVVTSRSGAMIPQGSRVGLRFLPAQPANAAPVEDILGSGTVVADNGGSATATVDLAGKAPGDQVYVPIVIRPDGTVASCDADCRFSVVQAADPAPTSVTPMTQQAGTTQQVVIRGTGFAEGAAVTVELPSGALPTGPAGAQDVVVTDVVVVSTTEIRAQFRTLSGAKVENRDVTVTNTDGKDGVCANCYGVTAAPSMSPSPSPSTSPSGSPSPTAAPAPAQARYVGLATPDRVLDTRTNGGRPRSGQVTLDLAQEITDVNATAAVLNVTTTAADKAGFLVAYPAGTTKPGTSNVNFEAARGAVGSNPATAGTQANEVVVRLPADRKVVLFVDGAQAHVIADLVGSFTTASTGGRVTTQAPSRQLDTRSTSTPLRSGAVVVDLTGKLPAGATAAILNVTATRTTGRGFVVAYPTGTSKPETSNVNFDGKQTRANEVVSQLGTGPNANKVTLFVEQSSAALVVDLIGAVTANAVQGAQAFTALSTPARAFDSRANGGARRTGNVTVQLPTSIPTDATGVVLNVTATRGTVPGFLTVFPAGGTKPGTSNVNFIAARAASGGLPATLGTQANEVVSALGTNRSVTVAIGGNTPPEVHVIVDVVGYLTPQAAAGASPSPSAGGGIIPLP